MTTTKLLAQLRDLNIKLWLEEGRLRFRAPKGAMTPALQTQLQAHKAEIVAFLREAAHGQGANEIAAAPRSGALPLALAQERLWFLDQLQAGAGTSFNMPAALQLEGELNVPALTHSLNMLVARHESLRTNIVLADGAAQQVIAPQLTIELPVVDISASSNPYELQDQIAAESARPFDLAHDPLLRATLLRQSDTAHVLLLTLHHIISDGWSIKIMVEELSVAYWASLNNQPAPLPELTIQYADFAVWQRNWLQGEAYQKQLDYWKTQLAGAPPLLELPTYQPRPPVQSNNGARVSFLLDGELLRQLRALSQQHSTTLAMTLLAAFDVLLARYSNQHDVVIGMPIANRNHRQIESLIGFFLNTLAIRVDISDNPRFSELLGRVRQTMLEAYNHQDLPFNKLAEALQPERNLSYTPLYQASFLYQGQATNTWALPGFNVTLIEPNKSKINDDLTLEIEEIGETEAGLRGYLDYSTALFQREFIEGMAAHFEVLLRAIVADPQQNVLALPLLSAQERHHMLYAWNQTQTDVDLSRCFHQQFEEQAHKTPNAIAVQFGDEALTYAELNARADVMAHNLAACGVGSASDETIVALVASRNIEFLTTLLAIFKAGGTYLPIDPKLPPKRIAQVLAQSSAPLILTTSTFLALVQEAVVGLAHAPVVKLVESLAAALTPNPSPAGEGGRSSDTLAYVIFTSGSTGVPKGAMVEHRGLMNQLHSKIVELKMTAADAVAQTATQSFVISVWQFLAPLLNGGRVQIIPDDMLLSPAGFLDEVARRNISILEIVPSQLQLLVEEIRQGHAVPACLRWVMPTGEALPPALARAWLQVCPQVPLVNAYGSSECSDDVAYSFVTQAPAANTLAMPIGKPILNMQMYVLDSQRQPVPVGVLGELYVSGPGVGRGYFGDAVLTAEKFLTPDLFGQPNRLYKTGDKARYLPDGNIEYLGRLDFQVKVRGFRIELGEIEATLDKHPAVARCVVVAREDARGAQQLAAYVVLHPGSAIKPNELRTHVGKHLPDYMVPAACTILSEMPLNNSGKIDRKALPAPVFDAITEDDVAPGTPTENVLAQIWRETLNVQRISTSTSFFDMGGHSLLATQVVSRIRQRLNVEIPLRELFERPTIAALAQFIDASDVDAARPPVQKMERGETVPLSYSQQRLWMLEELHGAGVGYVIPLAIKLHGPLDATRLHASLNLLVARHEGLRTTFENNAGTPMQRIHPAQPIAMPIVDLRHLPEAVRLAEAETLAQELTNRPFDLRTGPLLRVTLYQLGAAHHVLFIAMHHIVTDGWSMRVVVQEIMAGYQANLDHFHDRAIDVLPVQYADYALWQRNWLQGDVLRKQLSYWTQQLADVPLSLDLATDRPRPTQASYRSEALDFVLDAELTQALNALAKRNGATVYMTVLAALAALLSRYSGQHDLVIGSAIANRTDPAIESLIGFFLNTLPMRVTLQDEPSFTALLRHVKRMTLDAYANQDVPFEQIVEALKIPHSPNRAPLLQVLLAWQDFNQAALLQEQSQGDVAQLDADVLEWKKANLDLDLMLSMGESNGLLTGLWEYSTDLFDPATMTRMMAHFQNLLRAIVMNPDAAISTLPLLSADEQANAVALAEDETGRDFPLDKTVAQLFEAQAARTPNAIAVSCEDDIATYRQLNERADQWARALAAHGVGPEVIVTPFFARSIDFLTAILAIFKAGGAYLPLDPHTPTARIRQILTQSKTPLVLTNAAFLAQVQAAVDGMVVAPRVVLIEALSVAEAPSPSPSPVRTGEGWPSPFLVNSDLRGRAGEGANLAYVIFTSGSTGVPKGVMVEQRGLVNHLCAMQKNLSLSATDVIGQTATQSYVISVWQFLAALITGAQVQIVPEEMMLNALTLLDEIERRDISVVQIVPSVLRLLIEAVEKRAGGLPACVRWMIPTGEALPPSLVHAWFRLCPHVPLLNAYGSSECSDDVAHDVITEPSDQYAISMPAGRPIPNVQMVVLDAHGQPVPQGVAGELYVGGAGVGRGYLFDEALTAQKFVIKPASSASRLYKTGDRARVLPNGKFEYLGRLDFQVKIRGNRIELGEIEAVLSKHAAVAQAVLLARENTREGAEGAKQLVAYVVLRPGTKATAQELRAFVGQHLPDYMVPAAVVLLEAIPLNASGKVDRKALPAPTQLSMTEGQLYIAPRNATEAALIEIVSAVLNIPYGTLGIHHNFFDLGGHSLQAMQIIWRMRERFGVDLPLRALFEKPTVSLIAEQLSRTSPLLNRPPMLRADRSQDLALSYAQQRLWLMDQLDEGGGYVIPAALKLSGTLDVARLQASLSALVARHESLRTTFESVEGVPVQRIHAPVPIDLPWVDLRHLPPEMREAEAQRRANDTLHTPFDLTRGPLMRCRVYQVADEAYVLYVLMHHIITDGWSIPIMAGEVMQHYANPSELLPTLELQYADYAQWQRSWLQGDVLQTQLNYWTKQLSDAPPLIELPTDRPRTTTPSFKADSIGFVIDTALTQALNTLAQQHGATPYMLMVGAYALLLSRYSNQSEVVIGTPIANRTEQATESLIGFFVNTLALRLNLSSASDFAAVLREVRRVTLDGQAHQDVSFEQIVDALKLPRAFSHTPVFQVLFAWQNFGRPALQTDEIHSENDALKIEGHTWQKTTIEYDLVLSMREEDGQMFGLWEYSTDLFDRATMARMVAHFQNLLKAIASHAEQPINTLPMLDAHQAQQMLVEWNRPLVALSDDASDVCVHELFEAQAARTPDAIALAHENGQMRYAELNDKANAIAHALQQRGIKPGDRIAICAERSPDMVLAVLGAMKAGAMYVPLDPDYPAERLAFVLEDAQVALVLAQKHLVGNVAGGAVGIDALLDGLQTPHPQPLSQGERGATKPIYMIYTSGSTGQPKGVVVMHKGVANTVQAISQTVKMGVGDRFLQFAPFGFDVSAMQMFTTLTSGATLVLHREVTQLSVNELHALCDAQGVTVLDLPVALWQQWVDTLTAQGLQFPQHLRASLTGGDKTTPQILQAWAKLADHEMTFLCSYGPTEASITTTTFVTTNYEVNRNPPSVIPLGNTLPNTAIYILDGRGQLAPVGVAGEVFIGGAGVAQGYWQQAVLTRERFLTSLPAVSAHLNGTSPKRFYRTGDLARWLPDGRCEFMGRADTQVKIRGFRIELGEIETQIKALPQVSEAVVLVISFDGGDKRIVAYYQPSDAQTTQAELTTALRGVLPPHMLPNFWVRMQTWPLTPSQKLDRNALPKPDLTNATHGVEYVAPRNAVEHKLAAIWQEVLGLAQVGVESDFFDLGGHSLLATQIVSRVRKVYGLDFPLRSLMESPTVAHMAALITNLQSSLELLRPTDANTNNTNDTNETNEALETLEL